MLYKNHFYNQLTKKYAKVMGTILSDIDVVTYNQEGLEESRQKVPVTYSPKEKYIRRIFEDPDLNRQTAITLPRIGYELTNLVYASERKLSSKQKILFYDETRNNSALTAYLPVPYDFYFQATIITKTQEDMFQILEQLIPFFTPDYTIKMRGVNNPNISYDVPITLVGMNIEDTYSGELDERRTVTCDINFLLKGFIFGPVRENGIVKQYSVNTFLQQGQFSPATGGFQPAPNLQDPAVIAELLNQPNKTVLIDTGVVPFIEGVPLDTINRVSVGINFQTTNSENYGYCFGDSEW